jgi:hypothetical protein
MKSENLPTHYGIILQKTLIAIENQVIRGM